LDGFKKILADQRAAGVAGVIPCGTTGESPTLTVDEKKTLIRAAIDGLKGTGVKVIAGTGSNNTAETVELSRWASEQGADGLLIVMPYYNKPTPAGQIAHFTAVADAVKCPIMLYNVPGRTGLSMTADTIAQLAAHPRIRMLKEATGNVAFTSEVLDAVEAQGRELLVFSGDDATYLPLLAVGAVGVVSVASNLFPRAMVAIQKAYEGGDARAALRLQKQYYPLFRDLFVEANPGPIKAAMAWMGFGDARMRLPMAPMTAAGTKKLQEALARCGLEKGKPA
jgi:4-hydroxy-tetrahydrodipicolinate synthase